MRKLFIPLISLFLAMVTASSGAEVPQVKVPVLRQAVSSGQTIDADDIAILSLPATQLNGNTILDANGVIGKAAKHPLVPGRPLRANDLQRPLIIQKGAIVALNVNWPHIQLSTVGRAIDGGGRGDVIQVINMQSHKTVSGIITDVNQVEVGMRRIGGP